MQALKVLQVEAQEQMEATSSLAMIVANRAEGSRSKLSTPRLFSNLVAIYPLLLPRKLIIAQNEI